MDSADSNTSNDLNGDVPAAVSAQGITFTYENAERPSLKALDVRVPAGTTTAVVGASGAGKSTFCLTLNGLIPEFVRGEFAGRLNVLGRDMNGARIRDVAASVGMVLQDFEAQLFSTSAELEVAFGLENLGVPPDRMGEAVSASLKAVGLSGFEKRDPSGLSGGEKQRLALGAVLAMEPQLLVLDEPTSDLDPGGRREVLEIVKRLGGAGRSVVLVEHETDELLGADQVVVLHEGRKALSGAPEEVFRELCGRRLAGGVRGETGRVDGNEVRLDLLGVRPPQLAELAALLRLNSIPPNLNCAEELIRENGLVVDAERAEALSAQQRPKAASRPLLVTKNLSYSYQDGQEAVRDVSLRIDEGEFVAILGQNGSGKTTLVKHFNGLLLPQDGMAEVDGIDTRSASISELSRRVGYVFQNPDHQIFCESVSDELAFGPRNAGVDSRAIAEGSKRALAAVEMDGHEDNDPFALTKGERQRVALASVLVMEPSVIVMDEPTTGLDYVQQKHVMELLRELNRRGHTIVIITHSLWLASQYARRTVVMDDGLIVADGPTRDVLASPDGLERLSLVSPPAVELGRRLGVSALNARELAFCLGAEVDQLNGGAR
jgi:energy-coupling factor transport system ATP-binding protein